MIQVVTLHTLKNIEIVFFAVLLINLVNELFFTEEKMQPINLLKIFLIIVKMMKKHFNKNLVMSAEVRFQSSNKCWYVINYLM